MWRLGKTTTLAYRVSFEILPLKGVSVGFLCQRVGEPLHSPAWRRVGHWCANVISPSPSSGRNLTASAPAAAFHRLEDCSQIQFFS